MRWLHKLFTFALCLVAVPSWAQQIQQTTLTTDETILAGQVIELDGTNLNLADSSADVVVGVAALGATSGQVLLIRSSGIVTCPCEVGAAAGEYLSPGAVAGSGNAGSAAPTLTSFGYILGGRDGSGNCRILFGRFIVQAGAVSSLDDLSDVDITGPLTTNDGLIYDGANYVDEPIDINQLANTDIGSLTIGDIYFVNGAGNITRLPIGSAGEELTVVAGVPLWGIGGQGGAVVISVEKATAGTINTGDVVYIASNTAGVIEVELAQADAAGTMPAIGIAAETITDSAAGNVVVIGTTNSLNTSAFSEGDVLYVSDSVAGALTGTKPTGTNLIQNMGVVSRSHVTLGELNVGAGRTNDLPNLPQNQLWVGNGSAVPTAVANLIHEAGGLEADVSLYDGLAHISGGVTTNLTNFNWQNSTSALALGVAEFDVDVNGTTIDMLFSSHVEGATLVANVAGHTHSDVAGNGALFYGARSRGTDAAETIIQDGDNLAWWAALGHDGVDYERAAEIWMEVDGTPGSDDMPGRIVMRTTADGATVPTERFRISADGTILMSNHTFDTSNLTAGVVPEVRGGTGEATFQAALDNGTGVQRTVARTDFQKVLTTTTMSTTAVVGAISGAPAGQVISYGASLTADEEQVIDAFSASTIADILVRNTTRSQNRVITAIDIGANTLTMAGDISTWADTDALDWSIDGGTDRIFVTLDPDGEIPTRARWALCRIEWRDSGAIGGASVAPFIQIGNTDSTGETGIGGMAHYLAQVSGRSVSDMPLFPISPSTATTPYTFWFRVDSSGSQTMAVDMWVHNYIEE